MNNRERYEKMALETSRKTTRIYSTSFSLATRLLGSTTRKAIYAIYGLVRLADEIVDTMHDMDKEALLNELQEDTFRAMRQGFSLNPILHSFQRTAHRFHIKLELITAFFDSMRMDLDHKRYDPMTYSNYVYGSAEVVGLMCLRVFVGPDEARIVQLEDHARSLGAAFQKVNFLRDLKEDYFEKGRLYFPAMAESDQFNQAVKKTIESEIEKDFQHALGGIRRLPFSARLGVYIAYRYYQTLFRVLKRTQPHILFNHRIRISNLRKVGLLPMTILRVVFDQI
ncbi:MAG: phytoene/squalene synthase family protein [Fidelibacterota bacterium]|nr:MAG: phytoene/squalene synthase family protein [Candidatus Neomarinimicrobiota bacterium]